jgi:CRP/FNR family cyclic AMP-dependent transcriptional regulator
MFLAIEKIVILKNIELFSNLTDSQLIQITSVMEEEEISEGVQFVTKGDNADCIYIIINGEVKLHEDGNIFQILQDNECFGIIGSIDGGPRWASATAVEDTLLFKLNRNDLLDIMEENYDISLAIINVLCGKIRQLTTKKGLL